MEIVDSISLFSHKGRIIVNPKDEKVNMILAWFFLLDSEHLLNICVYDEVKTSGLWSRVKVVNCKEEMDVLIISNTEYDIYKIPSYIIDIEHEVRMAEPLVDELVRTIDCNLEMAYADLPHYSNAYMEAVSYLPNMYYRDDVLTNADFASDYVNIVGTLRYTKDADELLQAKRTVHFFGDSRMYGLYVEDKHTIPSIVSHKTRLKCINHGVHGTSIFDIRGQIEHSDVVAGDIIIINNGFVKSEIAYSLEKVNKAVVEEIIELNKFCVSNKIKLILCAFPDCGDKKILTDQEWRYCLYQELQKIGAANSKYKSLDADWDIVIPSVQFNGVCCCNTIPIFEKTVENEVFVDYIHFSPAGNRLIAEEISKYISALLVMENNYEYNALDELKNEYKRIVNERKGDKSSKFFDNEKFERFIAELKNASFGISKGAAVIVMNANPFTLGHLYILEESLKRFPHLYVLVVQEEHTVVPFEDRINLIKAGTKHLDNLTIIPSSEFVVSTVTLPEYFNKEREQLVTVDASRDIALFVEYVMPALNVSVRVAGEEPYCLVTREYNRQIKETFEKKGKIFIQIERKKENDVYISASKVRRALIENDFELIKNYVPETTYTYLLINRNRLISRMSEMELK